MWFEVDWRLLAFHENYSVHCIVAATQYVDRFCSLLVVSPFVILIPNFLPRPLLGFYVVEYLVLVSTTVRVLNVVRQVFLRTRTQSEAINKPMSQPGPSHIRSLLLLCKFCIIIFNRGNIIP